jgi:CheY-like chemotaxis protein
MKRALSTLAIALAFPLAADLSKALAQEEDREGPVAAAAPAAGAAPAQPIVDLSQESAVIQSIMESQPSTPRELVHGISLLIDLRRPELAKPWVQALAGSLPDEAGLAALAEEFGSATFLKIAHEEVLNPEGRQASESVLAAAHKRATDPARIAALIGKLQDPSAAVRRQATVGLRASGAQAAAALIAVLADEARAAEHPRIRTALVGVGQPAVQPLIAALDAPQEEVVVQSIEVLGRLESQDAAPYLLAPSVASDSTPAVRAAAAAALQRIIGHAPTPRQAASLLYKDARTYYERRRPLNPDPEDQVEVWDWDAAASRPVPQRWLHGDASLRIAARLSADLDRLAPESRLVSRLYLGSLLESASYEAGLDQPLPSGPGTARHIAAGRDRHTIHDLLTDALATGRPRVATAAVQVLADQGAPELLDHGRPEPSALVEAALAGDRRLSLAALESIRRLQPGSAYPGSSLVLERIVFLAGSAGQPRALVAETRRQDAQRLVGLLAELGYEADVVVNCEDLLRAAARSPDYELALVDIDLPRWPMGQVIEQLRRDGRSGGLPVGLLVPPGEQDRGADTAERDPLVVPLVRPTDPAGMQTQLGRCLRLLGRDLLPAAERRRQAQWALEWLTEIASQPDSYYDFRRAEGAALTALTDPGLAPAATALLARLGTPATQRALVDAASQGHRPLDVRDAAAGSFRQSVARFGTLLTTDEIVLQYERYNQSATADAGTQRVLGAILDTIEQVGAVRAIDGPPLGGENGDGR